MNKPHAKASSTKKKRGKVLQFSNARRFKKEKEPDPLTTHPLLIAMMTGAVGGIVSYLLNSIPVGGLLAPPPPPSKTKSKKPRKKAPGPYPRAPRKP